MFLLLSENNAALPPTILSRCAQIPVYPVSDDECRTFLIERFPEIPEENIDLAVQFAGGNIGKGMSFLREEITEEFVLAEEIAGALITGNNYKTAVTLERLARIRDRKRIEDILGMTAGQLRLKFGTYDVNVLLNLIEKIQYAGEDLRKNANPGLVLSSFGANISE